MGDHNYNANGAARRRKARPGDCRIMFDADVAAFFGVSLYTLRRRVKSPMPGEIDLNGAEPQKIGSRRIWLRSNVERLVGMKS